MKLQVLVPHYTESIDVLTPLLDSLAIQQSVDLQSDVGVIICHDGPDAKDFDQSDFSRYPFQVKQIRQEHKGVSAARNACLDAATADYVMFCDIDDMFFNACGLYMIFFEINNGGFDSLVSNFVEETRNPLTGDIVYINREMDSTFVHGKVHKRKYLIRKKIRWNDKLTIHEDSYFNILCQNLSKNVKYCPTPFYLWKWRDASVCRHDPKYILKTYRNLIDSNDALVTEFLRRKVEDKAKFFVAFMVFDAYYLMNKPEWVDQENKEYRDSTEKHFAQWYKKYKIVWDSILDSDKTIISNNIRSRTVGEGMNMERTTLKTWLRHIEKLQGGSK